MCVYTAAHVQKIFMSKSKVKIQRNWTMPQRERENRVETAHRPMKKKKNEKRRDMLVNLKKNPVFVFARVAWWTLALQDQCNAVTVWGFHFGECVKIKTVILFSDKCANFFASSELQVLWIMFDGNWDAVLFNCLKYSTLGFYVSISRKHSQTAEKTIARTF